MKCKNECCRGLLWDTLFWKRSVCLSIGTTNYYLSTPQSPQNKWYRFPNKYNQFVSFYSTLQPTLNTLICFGIFKFFYSIPGKLFFCSYVAKPIISTGFLLLATKLLSAINQFQESFLKSYGYYCSKWKRFLRF